jgi:class 3 adenylate cyclase
MPPEDRGMKCPYCQTANPEGKKFCRACGMHLLLLCPHCASRNLLQDKFCGECGLLLEKAPTAGTTLPARERKYVTILFSDLSGYTTLAERLDPEEVNEIMSRLFGKIGQVITTYEGFIEKFIGDAVMVIFGAPKAHEDDPVRAIYAALHIHDVVTTMSPQWEKKVGRKLLMHSGISTGLVVTASVNPEKGTYGISGDTINLASRLEGCAGTGEILVDAVTYQQTKGYFTFTPLGPRKVKGKTAAIISYKVMAPKERPCKVHRTQGLRAALIGREKEMATFAQAVEQLLKGKGSLISICGDIGTGKSRLLEEFKASLEQKEVAWQEGYAYAYAQNISYAPFRDLLNQLFQVEESDAPHTIRAKVESRIASLVGTKEHVVPYVGSLYALSYPETHNLDLELCKSRLQEAIKSLFEALATRKPTVIFFEDLHWADPSSRELFRSIIRDLSNSVLFICTFRPTFSLSSGKEIYGSHKRYHEITLHDLSSEKIKALLSSLLKTTAIPSDLESFLEERIEGNPFYVEEIINVFAESGILICSHGSWKLTRTLSKSDIPLTVNGVITARLDRLEPTSKRILQEASVIGKSFPYAGNTVSNIPSPRR